MKILDLTRKSLASLESTLIIWYRPSFLHITNPDEDNDIQVLISSRIFNNKTVQERIQMVMATIMDYTPELFQDRLIIIQAYTPEEMDDVLEYVFDSEQPDVTTEEI